MNTYKVLVLNTLRGIDDARVDYAFVRAAIYADAWKFARAALNAKSAAEMFSDAECKTRIPVAMQGDDFVVVKIVDMKPRNVKLDRNALREIIADPKSSDAEKLAAMQAMIA